MNNPYRALAKAVDKPTKRIGRAVCEEINLIRETITYKAKKI
jgi:hypothetical protein